ncbi:MAG: class II aldolase/adducin family protein [Candidatus Omnitrophica bacterium]|nr:class II aldolase/adducin family protein [Candidatus Omnitrophota bacterium]MCM8827143.1 class II aldolase/adducin family protein [Candidatus Omnitrophota bacterium]
MSYSKEKKELLYWAHLLGEKNFTTGSSGNISYRIDDDRILITCHGSYLRFLEDRDILVVDKKGKLLEGESEITMERLLHLSIHSALPQIKAVIHAHPIYTIAFFHYFARMEIFSFEAKLYLGDIKPIPQDTPNVTDVEPVLKALENTNIVVLKNHGVVSVGEDFKKAFSLIELLEEQAKINILMRKISEKEINEEDRSKENSYKYKLLSKEHISKLIDLVNNDNEAQQLGRKYNLTCTLAVKNQDTNCAVRFYYSLGKIINVDDSDDAEFVIIGKEEVLKKIFNRQIDPFVASTQGKVKTKGDFSKMSQWYPVLVRTFKLWEKAPVE